MRNEKEIRAIHKKYGETAFRMGVAHLFDVGSRHLTKESVEAACEKLIRETPDNSLLTGEMQAALTRCAYELSKQDVFDVITYVAVHLPLNDFVVREGKLIEVRRNGTEESVCVCTVPSDTDEEFIDEAFKSLEYIMGRHELKHGDYSEFNYAEAVTRAFKEVGVRVSLLRPDKTHFI